LPVATTVSPRVRDWQPDRLGQWTGTESSLAEIWLSDPPREIARKAQREIPAQSPPLSASPRTASR
jgi:hypothetical protein